MYNRLTLNGGTSASSSLLPPEQDRVKSIDAEIADVDAQIRELQALKQSLQRDRQEVLQTAQARQTDASNSTTATSAPLAQSSRALAQGAVDFTTSDWPWSGDLLNRAKRTWGINNWRMCQEGVVNAVLEGRDVVCIMPTGGGKSLCYQLPAIMSVGITLVVSPLISLSTDQCFHLQEAGIPCEFMSSSASRESANDILRRVRNAGLPSQSTADELKILFVTPERIAKSKSLLAALQKAYERGRLARIVIDEAHCCSNQGHDFRPDYRKLSILRKIFPDTKTTCLTATCSPKALKDVLNILGMPSTTEPTAAWPNRTVYFTAPLHRPNLIYKVLTRPTSSQASAQMICDWILEHHDGHTGIVYCLSRKDTETMAAQLSELSNGRIKTGCYHADVDDDQKHRIHVRWREGRIRVVCATIAFGMGIDKPDVRFVLHSGISKSLEGYYQESGRAGRDGNPSDCVLFYRPQDASRMSSLVAGEPTGREKLTAMLDYAQSSRCRKLLFGDYFEDAHARVTSTAHEVKCGKCDNCVSPPDTIDVSVEAWQIVNALQDMYDHGGRITVAALADLVRGLKRGAYTMSGGGGEGGRGGRKGKRKRNDTATSAAGKLDMSAYGGKITTLNSDEVERVIITLLNTGFLTDDYNATAYSVNVYVAPGRLAIRFTRVESFQEAKQRFEGSGVVRTIGSGSAAKGKGKGKNGATDDGKKAKKVKSPSASASTSKGKRPRGRASNATIDSDAAADDDIDSEEELEYLADKDEYEQALRADLGGGRALDYDEVADDDYPSSAYEAEAPQATATATKRKRHVVSDDEDDGDVKPHPSSSAASLVVDEDNASPPWTGRAKREGAWEVYPLRRGVKEEPIEID